MLSYEEDISKINEKKKNNDYNQKNQSCTFNSFDQVRDKIDQIIHNEPELDIKNKQDSQEQQKNDINLIELRDQLEKKQTKPEFQSFSEKKINLSKSSSVKEELFEIANTDKPKKSFSIPIHKNKQKTVKHTANKESEGLPKKQVLNTFFKTDKIKKPVEKSNKDQTRNQFHLNFSLFSKKQKNIQKSHLENADKKDVLQDSIIKQEKESNIDQYKKDEITSVVDDKINENTFLVSESVNNDFEKKSEAEEQINPLNQTMDEEILKLLAITDELLGKLPQDVISDFASSDDFILYEKVMKKYNIIKE